MAPPLDDSIATQASLVGLTDQLLYKLASLDSTVQQGFRRLDERMDRFQADLHENVITTNDKINNLDKEFREAIAFKRARIDGLVAEGQQAKKEIEKRIGDLETWKAVAVAKISVIMIGLTLAWTLIAPTVRNILGISPG
jgi:predicted  nucleic acid-binding Zn-ribbon protein